jgi:hypothetical protein
MSSLSNESEILHRVNRILGSGRRQRKPKGGAVVNKVSDYEGGRKKARKPRGGAVVNKVSDYEGGAFNPLSAIIGMMNPLGLLGMAGNGRRQRKPRGGAVVNKVSDYEGGGMTGLFDWLGPLNMLGLGKMKKPKRAPTARGMAVSKLMREKGMTLGEASKYLKQHGGARYTAVM